MQPTTRPTWTNAGHWPTCHSSQRDAGLPDGPLREPAPATHWPDLLFGALIGALLIGPALAELAELWGAL